jgi:hypothetical protein
MVAPLVIPLAAVIAAGVGAAVKGAKDITAARSIAKDARAQHESALHDLETAQKPVHERVAGYGAQQLGTVSRTIGRFADWIERNQRAVNHLGNEHVDGLEVNVPELPTMRSEVKQAKGWLKGGIAGAGAAVAAPQAALMGVSAFASASTGTAISSLSGAAATNATLAWLGGGRSLPAAAELLPGPQSSGSSLRRLPPSSAGSPSPSSDRSRGRARGSTPQRSASPARTSGRRSACCRRSHGVSRNCPQSWRSSTPARRTRSTTLRG